MRIQGLQKLTLLDYPEHVACTVFTAGCNFRCPFCHNASLVVDIPEESEITEDDFFDFLKKRVGVLDGVCVSGGEPLLQPDIESFLRKIKELGYAVKLDTNGSFPEKLKQLVEKGLVDYVAMDIKNSFEDYGKTSGVDNMDISNIKRSIEILKSSNVCHEFRTTVVRELHDFNKIKSIISYIGVDAKYYLQNYRDCETVLVKGFHGFEKEELLKIKDKLNNDYPNVSIRGI